MEFHRKAICEMLRVCREVRIFPIVIRVFFAKKQVVDFEAEVKYNETQGGIEF